MSKLSVVISAYNEEKNLTRCLKSVKDLASEIIVVDNESTDQTAQIAKKFWGYYIYPTQSPDAQY